MKPKEAMKQHNESYLTTLKQAHNLTDMRTLGIERKGFIKHALAWAIEKHSQQEAQSKRLAKVEELLNLYQKYFKLNDIKVIDGGHTYGDSRNTKESITVIEKIKEIEDELK
jgi:hypothetical protein